MWALCAGRSTCGVPLGVGVREGDIKTTTKRKTKRGREWKGRGGLLCQVIRSFFLGGALLRLLFLYFWLIVHTACFTHKSSIGGDFQKKKVAAVCILYRSHVLPWVVRLLGERQGAGGGCRPSLSSFVFLHARQLADTIHLLKN